MTSASDKAKRTRAKNLKIKAKETDKLKRARADASRARTQLKAYKEGFKDALEQVNR